MTWRKRVQRSGLILCAIVVSIAAAQRTPPGRRNAVEPLSGDLVPYIADRNAALALTRVASARWTPISAEEMERGVIALEVIEVFCGDGLKPGQTVEITGKRYSDKQSRLRTNFDKWNTLHFNPGDLLMIALRRVAQGREWDALAAEQVPAPDAPEVSALRRACEIEHTQAREARIRMLQDALTSPAYVLRQYTVEAIGRRAFVSREEGARMIAAALQSPNLPPGIKESLARELASRYFFQYERGSDPVNVTVIGALARLVVANGDGKKIPVWTQFLASSLTIEFSKDPGKDHQMRESLIRAVKDPSPDRVIHALEEQAHRSGADARIGRLIDEWKTASR